MSHDVADLGDMLDVIGDAEEGVDACGDFFGTLGVIKTFSAVSLGEKVDSVEGTFPGVLTVGCPQWPFDVGDDGPFVVVVPRTLDRLRERGMSFLNNFFFSLLPLPSLPDVIIFLVGVADRPLDALLPLMPGMRRLVIEPSRPPIVFEVVVLSVYLDLWFKLYLSNQMRQMIRSDWIKESEVTANDGMDFTNNVYMMCVRVCVCVIEELVAETPILELLLSSRLKDQSADVGRISWNSTLRCVALFSAKNLHKI